MNDQSQTTDPSPPDKTPPPTQPSLIRRILTLGIGPLIGITFLAIAIIALLFFNPKPQPEPRVNPIRPAKLLTIGTPTAANTLIFPGRVKAGQTVELAFQVPGQIVELPVKQGDELKQGDLIAKLDSRDYINNLQKANADLTEKQTKLSMIQQLVTRKAATQNELIDATAAFNIAQAQVDIEQKALDDTTLTAPFAGLIAKTYIDNFQNIQAKEPIVSLQDVNEVEIIVDIPEAIVAQSQRDEEKKPDFEATFDFLPDRTFPLTIKEYQSEANAVTQTYELTLTMPAPTDILLLPGMTTTVHVTPIVNINDQPALGYAVPSSAVFQQNNQSYVWLVNPDTNAVSKQPVTVAKLSAGSAIITDGLTTNQTIVTSGVSQLHDNETVRPFNPADYGP
ncbi:Toluene efflux pump periplasmic linker protein TtgD precursor [Poriferisphaera corsica]|uniref:Toluene efflux pump periplasmic linker protein TtgD n=1 Tax=Poriferisphaera corsica TaxID=2528020 RepID=A0A517YQY2_9BACT|nr:efflux RND transporter periplasmic adaptor subunit [Poriferisphaera corsica]QDU32646.1 Toluene efflux pump periplasmic linker protein TtgD precursor [Poriferisphaera corsica]